MADAAVAAEAPTGPRLTFVRTSDRGPELVSADANGGDERVILGGEGRGGPVPSPFLAPSWSADGSLVAVAEIAGKPPAIDLYTAAADGSSVRKLPGTRDAFQPVLSPDGRTVAFSREKQRRAHHGRHVTLFRSVSTWLLDIETGVAKRITPWQNGLFEFPASFSPDGSTLALSKTQMRADGGIKFAAIAERLDGSGAQVLATHATEPVYSPDGSRVALVATGKRRTIKSSDGETIYTMTDLAIANVDGSGFVRLTHTAARETQPSWDPSGQRLAYTRLKVSGGEADFFGFGDSLMEINADGSCQTQVLSDPAVSLFGPTWQPGPGREAGPIVC
jgi:TolB protein